METQPFMSVHETHLFCFPVVDFAGKASGTVFPADPLKLPSFGNWWVWGALATRVATGAAQEMASGVPLGVNIYDSGLGQYWWTGGTLNAGQLLPIQTVMGKAGNPGAFGEAKFVKGGSTLTPYVNQVSGATPAGSSQLYIVLVATLADSSKGNVPVVPSLGGVIQERKGEHYKAALLANASVNNIAVGQSKQFVIPLNKETAMIMTGLSAANLDYTMISRDSTLMDPRVSEANILVNAFDTRTTWKFTSPTGVPLALMFGAYAARQFIPPSFFFMQEDQNLAVELTNNTPGVLNTDFTFIFDGYLQQGITGDRIR